MGRPTSFAAASNTSPKWMVSSASRRALTSRKMFSTMITAASTRMPKSTAPSEGRLTGTCRACSKRTEAGRVPDRYFPEVAHPDGHALPGGHHHVADVRQIGQPAEPAHVIELAAELVETPARILVVVGERVDDVLDADLVGVEQGWFEDHLVLPRGATEPGIVRDAGDRFVVPEEDPVLEHLQLGRRAVGALQHVAIDQP